MNFVAQVADTLLEIGVEKGEENGYVITIGDQVYRADLRQIGDNSFYSLLVDGQSYEFYADGGPTSFEILLRGVLSSVSVIPQSRAGVVLPQQAVQQSGPMHVLAPMPGVVNDVYVQPEQAVERGERLLVLEAMKMNNEIHASKAGVVQTIVVEKGQRVNKGDTLVIIA